MTNFLRSAFGAKSRNLICLLGVIACFSLVQISPAHAAKAKARVAKTTASKVAVNKVRASRSPIVKKVRFASVSKRRIVTVAAKARSNARVPLQEAQKPSFGQIAGLHSASDFLNLKSSVALVVDQQTSEVLYSKNDKAVLPIASLTKLMTGLVVSDAHLPMEESIVITQEDVDTEKGSRSRLQVGSTLSRGELLHLALMSSENRAAHALGRTYPGGLAVFVSRMNAKAKLLGMTDTRYVEPTGLSSDNQSSARDLAKLVDVAYQFPLLRELTTSPSFEVAVGSRLLQFNNTNRLVKSPSWDIGLQKTGYISEAGRCLVMQASVAGRKLIMVFLDSAGKFSRLGDAERVRAWIESASNAALVENGVMISGG